jgi:hypothetical protein
MGGSENIFKDIFRSDIWRLKVLGFIGGVDNQRCCWSVSEIRDPVLILTPGHGIQNGKKFRIRDPRRTSQLIFLLGLKILKFFYADPDPGSGTRNLCDPRSGMEKLTSRIRNTDNQCPVYLNFYVILYNEKQIHSKLCNYNCKSSKSPPTPHHLQRVQMLVN